MGIDAVGVAVNCRSVGGCAEKSAGESNGTMKSSKFIASGVASWVVVAEFGFEDVGGVWSDKRNCAIPLGVGLVVSFCACACDDLQAKRSIIHLAVQVK